MRTYSEPKRFKEAELNLDNFADLAKKQITKAQGINSEDLEFEFKLSVNLNNIDDLVCAIEQDYYLNKIVTKKLHYLVNDPEQLESTFLYVNRYLSAQSLVSVEAKKVSEQSLSRLNLL